MKAKEYFEKYIGSLRDGVDLAIAGDADPIEKVSKEIFLAFVDDGKKIIENRRVRSNYGLASALKEVNQKWNVFCSLVEKELGQPIFRKDCYIEFWAEKLPGLKETLSNWSKNNGREEG